MPTLFDQLSAPFPADDLGWRVARSGIRNGTPWAQVLAYIDARAARARLNAVLGPENWKVEYTHGPANGVIATLSLRIGGEWIAKQDGADITEIEPVKGGLSGAFKRACAVWGIGEYLYDIGDSWAQFSENGAHRVKVDNRTYRWDPPLLLSHFLPADSKASSAARPILSKGSDKASDHQPVALKPVSRVTSAASRVELNESGPQRRLRETTHPERVAESVDGLVIPFGPLKGQLLHQMVRERPADVRSGRDWAAKAGRYPEYVAAVDALLVA